MLSILFALLLAPASAVKPDENGSGCTFPKLDWPTVPVQPAPTIKPQDVAGAATPVTVGTFRVKGTEFKLACKGAGTSLRCAGLAEGHTPVQACVAAVSATSAELHMAAMNMQFLAVVPAITLGLKPTDTIIPDDAEDAR